MADLTPPDRNRYVDFLRVIALFAVIIGHWLVIDVHLEDGVPSGRSVLGELTWAHWITWILQVIPVFFLIGGFANASSWRSHRARGGDWGSWIYRRSVRLLWPTTIFVAATGCVIAVAFAFDAPADVLREVAVAVPIPLWFLAAYLGVAAFTPLGVSAHDRWRLRFVVAMVGGVAIVDALRFLADVEMVALVNYLLVWGTFHQIGVAWAEGTIATRSLPWSLTMTAGAGLVVAVIWGPYPVSMVTVPGAELQNTGPPTLALLLFGLAQTGVVLLLRNPAGRWLRRRRVWRAVVAGNMFVMSAFLWHMIPVVIVSAILAISGFSLPGPVGSIRWLAFRLVWVVGLAVVLVPSLLLVARCERPPHSLESISMHGEQSGASLTLGLLGVGAASAGLAIIARDGFWAGETTLLPLWGTAGVIGGFLFSVAGGSLGRRPSPRT